MKPAPKVGPVLRKLRLARGMSQSDLEFLTGIPKARLSRYENGHVSPSLSSLCALAAGLDIRPSVILIDLEEAP